MTADPKPAARIVDPATIKRVRDQGGPCTACYARGSDPHHVIPKSEGGDDVEENLVMLCGSGSERCHGAFHGSPYVVTINADPRSTTQFAKFEERRDRDWVAHHVGLHLLARRLDTVRYVLRKLGRDPGLAYLERVYRLTEEDGLRHSVALMERLPENQLRADRPRSPYATT